MFCLSCLAPPVPRAFSRSLVHCRFVPRGFSGCMSVPAVFFRRVGALFRRRFFRSGAFGCVLRFVWGRACVFGVASGAAPGLGMRSGGPPVAPRSGVWLRPSPPQRAAARRAVPSSCCCRYGPCAPVSGRSLASRAAAMSGPSFARALIGACNPASGHAWGLLPTRACPWAALAAYHVHDSQFAWCGASMVACLHARCTRTARCARTHVRHAPLQANALHTLYMTLPRACTHQHMHGSGVVSLDHLSARDGGMASHACMHAHTEGLGASPCHSRASHHTTPHHQCVCPFYEFALAGCFHASLPPIDRRTVRARALGMACMQLSHVCHPPHPGTVSGLQPCQASCTQPRLVEHTHWLAIHAERTPADHVDRAMHACMGRLESGGTGKLVCTPCRGSQ